MLWAISGGAGFLGLHLARRLLADGHEVRTLDLAPLDDAEPRAPGRGAARRHPRPARARELVDGAPSSSTRRPPCRSSGSRESIRSVNVGGTATLLLPRSRPACGGSSSSRRRPSTAFPRCTRSTRTIPLLGVGHYGESKIEAEQVTPRLRRRGLDFVDRPPEDVHRAGAARRLRDPLRLDPRGPADLRARQAAEPLPAARGRGSRRRDRPRRVERPAAAARR